MALSFDIAAQDRQTAAPKTQVNLPYDRKQRFLYLTAKPQSKITN